MIIDKATLDRIKAEMGYHDRNQRCRTCKFSVPDNPQHMHCILSPAIDVPVDEDGNCNFFKEKQP